MTKFSPIKIIILLISLLAVSSILGFSQPNMASAKTPEKTLTFIGAIDDYPIMFADEEGTPSGLAVDLIEKFSEESGYAITYELYPSSQVNKVFEDHGDLKYNAGQVHGESTPTVSLPFYYKNYFLFTSDKKIKTSISRTELNQYLKKYTNQNVVIGYKGQLNDSTKFNSNLNALPYKAYSKYSDLYLDLEKENLKFALIPDELAKLTVTKELRSKLTMIPMTLYIEDATFELSIQNKALIYELNHFLLSAKKEGTLSELTSKWFTENTSPYKTSSFLFYFNILGVLSVVIVLMLAYKNVIMQKILDQKTVEIMEHTRVNELLYEKLLQEEQYKNNYFINLSHELRTPISIVLNASQICELALKNSEDFSGKAKSSKYIQVINANGYRLLRIITNLIDLNKVQAKEYNLKFESLDLLLTIEQLTSCIVENQFMSRDQFLIESNEEQVIIDADRFEISRILANLISNSCKFSEKNSKITIQIIQTNQHVIMSYRDFSTGISKEQIQELLSNSYYENTGLTTEQQSFGLGLYLSKELLRLHRAEFKVDLSETGLLYQIKFLKSAHPLSVFGEDLVRPSMDLNQLVRMEFSELKGK